MGRETRPSVCVWRSVMQLAAAVLLLATVAVAASDRGLLNIDIAVPVSKDLAALTSFNATAAAEAPAPTADIEAGMVQAARIAANAPGEWAAGDLQQLSSSAYRQIGCFQDGTSFTAARRLARRLAVTRTMTVPQCAARASAFGYSLFGITWYEDDPSRGYACWGAWDRGFATALGSAGNQCGLICGTWSGTQPTCGTRFTFFLYEIIGRPAADVGVGGQWRTMTELPIAGVHSMQITGRDEFLLVDFMLGTHPTFWNATYNVVRWNRNSNTWAAVPWVNNNRKDAACGMWVRMSDGDITAFSGHYGATFNGISYAADDRGVTLYRRHFNDAEAWTTPLPWGRWYGGSVLLPSGRVYVVGGTGGGRANGAEIWDPALLSTTGRTSSSPTGNWAPYPVNSALFGASSVGGYYPGLMAMPDCSLLFAQTTEVQTINVASGATIGRTPPLPLQMTWEFPQAAPVMVLQMEPYTPGQSWSVDWIAFGGTWQANALTPSRDYSLRVRLTLSASSPPTHTFSNWQVETMPGLRIQHDAVMLPNGKVFLINGGETGTNSLDSGANAQDHYFQDEPWVYDPVAPAGRRYSRTASYTNIFRSYHATAILTSFGDILVSGTSIGRGFRQYTRRPYSITPWPLSEYRIELFTPHYIANRPRPALAWAPTVVTYGDEFYVGLSGNTTFASIKSVVFVDGGSNTHSSIMANRNQKLSFRVIDQFAMWVRAPANAFVAPPTFYMLHLVANDDSYSTGRWVQLRPPFSAPPPTLRTTATSAVPQASSRFEPALGQSTIPFRVMAGSATLAIEGAAVGSWSNGLTIRPTTSTVSIASNSFNIPTGARVHTHLWARTSAANVDVIMSLGDASGNPMSGSTWWRPNMQMTGRVLPQYQHFPLGGWIPASGGTRSVRLTFTGLTPNVPVHLDDVETWMITTSAGSSNPVAAAAAAASGDMTVADAASAAAPADVAAVDAATAATATTAMRSSWMGDDTMTPKGSPDVPLAPSVEGNPILGVSIPSPMTAMMQVVQNIRNGLPGFTVTGNAGPGVMQ